MPSGFEAAGQCFTSEIEASRFLCGQFKDTPAGSAVVFCTYANYSPGFAILEISQYALNNKAAPTSRAISLPLQPCDLSRAAQPFDYAYAGAIWTLAFTFVLGLYLVSKKAGLILDLVRRG